MTAVRRCVSHADFVGASCRELIKCARTKKRSPLKGLTGAAALATASQAYGAIILRPTPANITGHDPASVTSSVTQNRLIDVDGDGTFDLRLSYRSYNTTVNGTHYEIQQSFVFSLSGSTAADQISPAQWYAYRLHNGDFIPGSHQFGQDTSYLTHICTYGNGYEYSPFWNIGDRGFVGFTFRDANNQLDYGYIELELDPFVDAAHPGGLRFFSLAYENSGGPMAVGQIPEPSTLAALAFGGAGLAAAAFRRRQKIFRRTVD